MLKYARLSELDADIKDNSANLDDLVALGASLRQAREAREINLTQMERLTRIRPKFLEAMESGDFDSIDSPLQLKGFLRAYARAVSLDEEAVVAHYDVLSQKASGKKKKKNPPTAPVDLSTPPLGYQSPATIPGHRTQPMPAVTVSKGRSSWRGLRLLLVFMGAVVLTGGVVIGAIVGLNELAKDPSPTEAPSILEFNDEGTIVAGTGDNPFSPTPTGFIIQPPTSVDTPSFEGAGNLTMSVLAEQRLWVKIVVDNELRFQGILLPGEGREGFFAQDGITVITTNAGALKITINNQEYRMGAGRTSAQQTFTLEGLISPTQEPSNTPTATSTITATFTLPPSITATLTGTATEAISLETSPSATLFFSPTPLSLPQTSPNPNQATPIPTQMGSSEAPTAIVPTAIVPTQLPSIAATLAQTQTSSPSPTQTPSRTPTITPSPTNTPTVIVTPTQYLPPRETRTALPPK